MKTIEENIAEIESDFSMFDQWVDKYAYLIDLGKSLPLIDAKYKDEDHLIRGCQSQVWLAARLNDQGRIEFTADSDAIITKGIIALLIRVMNGHTPVEVRDADLYFIERIGLAQNLSPTRANGLLAMIKQMKLFATAYASMQK